MKELSLGNLDVIYPINIDTDDEGVLADGMIPDSRIVGIIDDLEIINDDVEDSKITLEFLGLRYEAIRE
jgi:hypothetical protein